MSLVHNEQTKLTATYLNGVALALMAVGFFSPVISGLSTPAGVQPFTAAAGGLCVASSAALHIVARLVLRRLRP